MKGSKLIKTTKYITTGDMQNFCNRKHVERNSNSFPLMVLATKFRSHTKIIDYYVFYVNLKHE